MGILIVMLTLKKRKEKIYKRDKNTDMYFKFFEQTKNIFFLRVCGQLCGKKWITNEVGWACAQVFSTDGDFGPSRTFLGRDACDQRGLTGTRHGGLTQTGALTRSAPGGGQNN